MASCSLFSLFSLSSSARSPAGRWRDWLYRGWISPASAWRLGLCQRLHYAVRRNALPAGSVDPGPDRRRRAHEADNERGGPLHRARCSRHEPIRNGGAGDLGARARASEATPTRDRRHQHPSMCSTAARDARADRHQPRVPRDEARARIDAAAIDAEGGVARRESCGPNQPSSIELSQRLIYAGLTYARRGNEGTEETLNGATAGGRAFYRRGTARATTSSWSAMPIPT